MEEEILEMKLGSYGGRVSVLEWETESGAAEETMLLWGIQQPTLSKQNAFVSHSSLQLRLDACGHSLSILQSPSSLGKPGVTGAVMWDSGVVLGKCIAALLGAQVILTDLPDRLRLLKKNVESNLRHGVRGSAAVKELTWGDDPDNDLIEPPPDYGSDVIYSEGAVVDLLDSLTQLCRPQTTVFLSGELRNDTVLECFLEAAVKDFVVGRIDQSQWHPDYRSPRVVMYILVKN
ncbi:protein N-lysine methyltransferase METTL21A-like isoform X2 [Gossypium australe]|uniref:Protein N-lysine methyltransferase METTL21A-like isoform X2 n=1 Tax=Gossypium australe TaxID=47621 RepID=A0A5B6UYC6_9ROSI|nr:protein N-lysine methyltransferase METTL21A-like isoform X2 [Gossypium australe]